MKIKETNSVPMTRIGVITGSKLSKISSRINPMKKLATKHKMTMIAATKIPRSVIAENSSQEVLSWVLATKLSTQLTTRITSDSVDTHQQRPCPLLEQSTHEGLQA